MTRAGFPRVHLEAACTGSEMTTPRRYYTRIDETSNYANDIADELDSMFKSDCCDWDLVREAARVLRAGGMTPTVKTTARAPQSVGEAPCGSLLRRENNSLVVRLVDGTGWYLGDECSWPGVDQEEDGKGWEWCHRHEIGPLTVIAEGLTDTECHHLSGLSATDAIAWCEQRSGKSQEVATRRVLACCEYHAHSEAKGCFVDDDVPPAKPRPQPGDVVPWAEVEAGCLYSRSDDTSIRYPFRAVVKGEDGPRGLIMAGPHDGDLERLLSEARVGATPAQHVEFEGPGASGVLVASDLGTDPEAWRRAMRVWTTRAPQESK